jgi:endonuclease YncB( thermonuclease family)
MGWWSKDDKPKSDDIFSSLLDQVDPYIPNSMHDATAELVGTPWTTSHSILLGLATTASFALGVKVGRIRPVWRAIKSLQDLSSSDIGPTAPWMRGTVVSVSDGDTIRFLHRPTIFHSASNYDKDDRLNLRLCTIDTPETAKFGKPGQPFGQEAKEYLQRLVLDKNVRVRVLQMDQYGRGVAEVVKPGWLWNTYLDEAMLRAGLAEVYLGSGAVYGRLGKEGYLSIMEKAKGKGIGIWSDKKRETAAEYKRRNQSS